MNASTDNACPSDNKSMQRRPPTTLELLEEKLRNFKERFAQHFYDMGFTKEKIEGFGAIELISEIISVKLYWGMIDACNLDFFLALAAANPPPLGLTDAAINDWCKTQQLIIAHIQRMTPTDVALGWRYAHLFLGCVRELTAKK